MESSGEEQRILFFTADFADDADKVSGRKSISEIGVIRGQKFWGKRGRGLGSARLQQVRAQLLAQRSRPAFHVRSLRVFPALRAGEGFGPTGEEFLARGGFHRGGEAAVGLPLGGFDLGRDSFVCGAVARDFFISRA